MRNNFLAPAAALLLTGAAAAAGFYWWSRQASTPSAASATDEPARAPQIAEESARVRSTVRLNGQQLKEFGIQTLAAGPGRLRMEVTLPGEVALNADRIAHVVPRVSGIVREVTKNLGDTARRGEILAVLDSRELADSKATLLAARERLILAQSNFERESHLWLKKISPEQDYIQAKNSLAEAGIEVRTAEQKLRALGFSDDYVDQLSSRQERSSILYEIAAPFDGTVMEKHISLGEVLKDDSTVFVIADLSSVWVNLDVHQKDLPLIRIGQRAVISAGGAIPDREGRISFLEPTATETNRTIHARVVISNADGRYRPGLFVNGRVATEDLEIPILVPNEALMLVDGRMSLFVQDGDGFRLQAVTAGRTNGLFTEIVQGLRRGEICVIRGAYTLKSELEKPEAEH